MRCDECGKTIGDTLYEVGDKRLCPVCWLGEKEGNKPKYQRSTNAWTDEKLKAHKERMKEVEEKRNAKDGP